MHQGLIIPAASMPQDMIMQARRIANVLAAPQSRALPVAVGVRDQARLISGIC